MSLLSTTPDPPVLHGRDPANEQLRHFLLSLAVAWPVLWFWFAHVFGAYSWTWGVLLAVPAILLTGVTAAWWILTSFVWKAPAPGVIVAGVAGVGAWFVLALAALIAVPWIGIGYYVAFPNPLGFVAALIGGLGINWKCAGYITRRTGRGPAADLTVSLFAAAIVSVLSATAYDSMQRAEIDRLRLSAGFCTQGNNSYDVNGNEVRREGCAELGERVRTGNGEPRDLARALDILTWGCLQSESSSCIALGQMYERGEGVDTDLEKAYESYLRGCGNNSSDAKGAACMQVGRLVHEGLGVRADRYGANRIWSENGSPPLWIEMGLAYERGDGVQRNVEQATTFFDKACQKGHADGCAHLARVRAQ